MRRLKEQFPNELVVIGVHSAKFPSEKLTDNIRQAVMRLGIDHPVVNDAGFQIWNAYNVRAWPTLILIDPTGRIVGETAGEIDAGEMAATIREVIEQHKDDLNSEPLHLLSEREFTPERLLSFPGKLLVSPERHLFIADSGHHRILQVQLDESGLSGNIRRVFGSGEPGLKDGSASEAQFQHPRGLALKGTAETGTLYVADTDNHAVRAIELSSGQVRTVAGTGQKASGYYPISKPLETPLRSPWDLLVIDRYLLIAMAGSHQIWVLVDEDQLGIFAGNGREALVDGPPAEASFNQPSGLALGLNHVFVADPEASAIRAVALSDEPKVFTLAGQGLFDFGDRDGPGHTALLQHPSGVAFLDKKLYIADTYNHKIKVMDPFTTEIQTLAGTGQPGHRDGSLSEALFYEPEGIQAVNHFLYVADTNNHEVRVVDFSAGEVHTLHLGGSSEMSLSWRRSTQPQTAGPFPVRSGTVHLSLDLQLPTGYHRNPDTPSYAQSSDSNQPVMEFNADQVMTWAVEVDENQEQSWNITLYYCEDADTGLCKVTEQQVIVRLEVIPDGPDSARIPVKIEE